MRAISTPTTIPRRAALMGGAAMLLGAAGAARAATAAHSQQTMASGAAEWNSFLSRYVQFDGRVIDTGNGGISHSEGQGVGMLCAATFGDEPAFRLLLDWTERHLLRGEDALHSWRYAPNQATPVSDPNNATDGDLLIGLAMFTAADRWGREEYRRKGHAIAQCVRAALLTRTAFGTLLLPGVEGFTNPTDVTVNPSYYVFPALKRFAAELADPVWQTAIDDGLAFLARARFGSWKLSPDWASVPKLGGDLRPAGHWPARCSYDAVRVPLYLCWASFQSHPAVAAFANFWAHKGGMAAPAWSDLTGGGLAPYQLSTGMDAIRRFTAASLVMDAPADLPLVASASDYYSAALTMLVHVGLAAREANLQRSS